MFQELLIEAQAAEKDQSVSTGLSIGDFGMLYQHLEEIVAVKLNIAKEQAELSS